MEPESFGFSTAEIPLSALIKIERKLFRRFVVKTRILEEKVAILYQILNRLTFEKVHILANTSGKCAHRVLDKLNENVASSRYSSFTCFHFLLTPFTSSFHFLLSLSPFTSSFPFLLSSFPFLLSLPPFPSSFPFLFSLTPFLSSFP